MIHRNVKIFIAVAVALVIGLVIIANMAAGTKISSLENDTKVVKSLVKSAAKTTKKEAGEQLQAAHNPAHPSGGSIFKKLEGEAAALGDDSKYEGEQQGREDAK